MFVPLTPLRCLHRAVDLFGSKTGVVCGNHEFTYAQFAERSEKLATGLIKLGIQPGDRVAYLSFNNHQLLEGYYGVVQAKGIVMPLNVRLSAPELINILNHSGARMLIYENDFLPLIEQLKPQCKSVGKWVSINEKTDHADLAYEEILAQGRAERADIFSYDERSIAELFYTSGSTGTPKGVTHSHRTLYLHALSVASLMEKPHEMVDLHTIPLFHANGWGRPQASTMLGITQVMVRRFEPLFVFGLIQKYKATHMSLVPTMANALINSPEAKNYDLSSLRQIMIGGAAASPELIDRIEKALGGEALCGYGLTETAPVLSMSREKGLRYADAADRLRRHAMAGWPVPNVTIRVVDFDMKDVPKDGASIGEVIAMGDHVMEGYFKEPEATAAVMTGPWFHTGDMAVWDEDGYIHIVDRKKEIIISGGENISSIEVEKAIFAHPAVFECAVVAAPDERWGEVPVAIVVPKPDHALQEEELMAFLQERLGKFKLPRKILIQADPLPKTGTGKIKKVQIKEQFWAGKAKRVQG
ncbi:MAG: long-chain-fatty-acid--CoA ligase [Bryobacteraceae bacterium]|nr:long-chain-fatty-acid--CoA ligase [Bryobacteraceae bacterium]